MAPKPQKPVLSTDSLSPYRSHRKVYVEKFGLQIPMREVELTGSEPPVRLYDTSGPRVSGHEEGLPHLREKWIAARSGDRTPTQLHYARKGEITEEIVVTSQQAVISAQVTDSSGRPVERSRTLAVIDPGRRLGLKPRFDGSAGENSSVEFDLIAINLLGQ